MKLFPRIRENFVGHLRVSRPLLLSGSNSSARSETKTPGNPPGPQYAEQQRHLEKYNHLQFGMRVSSVLELFP